MRLPRPALWSLRIVLLLSSLSTALIGFTQATGTASSPVALQFDPYIHRVDGAPADPINLIFYGADADAVAAAVHRVLGWPVADGSPMLFVDQGITFKTAWQLAQPVSRSARFHLRIEAVGAAANQDYVLAAVHRDDDAACGHVGTAFDETRQRVATGFANAGYSVSEVRLGNTNSGPQCDGSFTAGDGTAAVIDLTDRADGG